MNISLPIEYIFQKITIFYVIFIYDDVFITNMKRKVIRQGHNTLTITLPAKWIQKKGIEAGEELDVIEKEDVIIISNENQASLDKIKVNLPKQSLLIRRYIGNIYRKGYDEVEFTYDEPKTFRIIQDYIQGFIGMEIIRQGKNFCTIKNVADINLNDFDTILNRMFLLTLNMSDDFLESIVKKDEELAKNVLISEKNHNKLFNCCLRIINKKGTNLNKNLYFTSKLLIRLEDIGDSYRDMSAYLIKHNMSVSSKFVNMIKSVNKLLKTFYEFHNKFDENKAAYFFEEKNKFIEKAMLLFETSPKHEIYLIHLIVELINNIYEGTSPVFGLNL